MSNENIMIEINEMLFKEENHIDLNIIDYKFIKGSSFQVENSYKCMEEFSVHIEPKKIELDLNVLNCNLKEFEKYIGNNNGEFYFIVNGKTEISKIEQFKIENNKLIIDLNESMFENAIENIIELKNDIDMEF